MRFVVVVLLFVFADDGTTTKESVSVTNKRKKEEEKFAEINGTGLMNRMQIMTRLIYKLINVRFRSSFFVVELRMV